MNNKTKLITIVGAMSALAVILAYFIHLPIIPGVPFLEYDPADILIYVMTYICGLPVGIIMTAIVSVIQGVTVSSASGIVGIIMHFFSTGTFVLIAGLISKMRIKNRPVTLTISTICGIIGTTLVMILWNLVVTPIFLGESIKNVLAILDLIILFNIVKATINGIISAVLARPIGKIIK